MPGDRIWIDRRPGLGCGRGPLFQRCGRRRRQPARPGGQCFDHRTQAARRRRDGDARRRRSGPGRARHRRRQDRRRQDLPDSVVVAVAWRDRLQRPDGRCDRPRVCRIADIPCVQRRYADPGLPAPDRSRRHDPYRRRGHPAQQRHCLLGRRAPPVPRRCKGRCRARLRCPAGRRARTVAPLRDLRRPRNTRWHEGGRRRIGLGRRRPRRHRARVQRQRVASSRHRDPVASRHEPLLRRRRPSGPVCRDRIEGRAVRQMR